MHTRLTKPSMDQIHVFLIVSSDNSLMINYSSWVSLKFGVKSVVRMRHCILKLWLIHIHHLCTESSEPFRYTSYTRSESFQQLVFRISQHSKLLSTVPLDQIVLQQITVKSGFQESINRSEFRAFFVMTPTISPLFSTILHFTMNFSSESEIWLDFSEQRTTEKWTICSMKKR